MICRAKSNILKVAFFIYIIEGFMQGRLSLAHVQNTQNTLQDILQIAFKLKKLLYAKVNSIVKG